MKFHKFNFNINKLKTELFSNREYFIKKYYFADLALLEKTIERQRHITKVCEKNTATPAVRWVIEGHYLIQKTMRIKGKVPQASSAINKLFAFSANLDQLQLNKFPHGDINRKNIIESDMGLHLVDFEPILEISNKSKVIHFRGTEPYIHPIDKKNKKITYLTDLLGFGCFSLWCHGVYRMPSLAVNEMLCENVQEISTKDNSFIHLYKQIISNLAMHRSLASADSSSKRNAL